jgi:peptidyl-prolyl cis-trans isomerase SurA
MAQSAPIRTRFARRIAVILSEVAPCWNGAESSFRNRGIAKSLVLALIVSASVIVAAQPSASSPAVSSPAVLDRVVAVVNRQVILLSDLDDEIRLSILEPDRGGELTPQQALEQLISRTLIEQQIREQDFQSVDPTQQEVDARVAQLRKQLPVCVRENCASAEGWDKFLAANGLTQSRVESYLRYRMEILNFIEQRFRQGIQISQQQIETYYHDTLLPQYPAGETAPPLDQVSSRIQEILLEQQVNILFDNWLTNLRQQGDVQVLDAALAPATQSPASHSDAEPSAAEPSTAVPTPNAPAVVPPPASTPATSAPSIPEPNHP